MYSEARKLDLFEKMKKVNNESLLVKVETMVDEEIAVKIDEEKRKGLSDLAGVLTNEEAEQMLVTNGEQGISSSETEKPNIFALLGVMTKEEVEAMEKALEESAEKIYPDEWK